MLGDGDDPTLNETLDKNEYCFHPMPKNDSIETVLMTCFQPFVEDSFLPYGRLNYEHRFPSFKIMHTTSVKKAKNM